MRYSLKCTVLAVAAVATGATQAFAQDKPVAIGTLPQGSLGFSIAAAVAKVGTENVLAP